MTWSMLGRLLFMMALMVLGAIVALSWVTPEHLR
jgi:hypothetical protein